MFKLIHDSMYLSELNKVRLKTNLS